MADAAQGTLALVERAGLWLAGAAAFVEGSRAGLLVVSELGQAVGYQDRPVEDGDDCEADDNTLNIEPAKKLGWTPQLDVYEYITNEQANQ